MLEKPVQIEAKTATKPLAASNKPKKKRGRPRKGEEQPKKPNLIKKQIIQSIEQAIDDLPTNCDVGAKKNSKGHKVSWIDYKLHNVPLIYHNPRNDDKIEFLPHEAERYKARSQAERVNSSLKDNHGGRHVRVKGGMKVYSHLMFGILVIAAEQIMRLIR